MSVFHATPHGLEALCTRESLARSVRYLPSGWEQFWEQLDPPAPPRESLPDRDEPDDPVPESFLSLLQNLLRMYVPTILVFCNVNGIKVCPSFRHPPPRPGLQSTSFIPSYYS